MSRFPHPPSIFIEYDERTNEAANLRVSKPRPPSQSERVRERDRARTRDPMKESKDSDYVRQAAAAAAPVVICAQLAYLSSRLELGRASVFHRFAILSTEPPLLLLIWQSYCAGKSGNSCDFQQMCTASN